MLSLDELWLAAEQADIDLFGREKKWSSFLTVIQEELEELVQHSDEVNRLEEFGDVLFVLVSYARVKGIDPRAALLSNIVKMRDRAKRKNKHASTPIDSSAEQKLATSLQLDSKS